VGALGDLTGRGTTGKIVVLPEPTSI
jgi:hypothetical protein